MRKKVRTVSSYLGFTCPKERERVRRGADHEGRGGEIVDNYSLT